MVPMSFRMSCFLVEMPADAGVLASWIDETKTRKSSMSLIGSAVDGLVEPNIYHNLEVFYKNRGFYLEGV